MAKKNKGNSFFKDAGVKLNREIKAEQKAQAASKQSGFMKQLGEHKNRDSDIYSRAKAKGQTDSLFRGQDVIAEDKRPAPAFDNKLDKMDPTESTNETPQGTFQLEQRINHMNKGIK